MPRSFRDVICKARPRHWLSLVVCVLTLAVLIILVVPGEPHYRTRPTGGRTPLLKANPPMMGGSAGAGIGPPPPGPHQVIEYEHGWPQCFVRRAKGYGGDGWPAPSAKWMQPWYGIDRIFLPYWLIDGESWSLGCDRWEWDFGALLVDLFVAAVLLAASTFAAERWISKRKSVLRWRLVDLLVVTVLVCSVLAWWRWHTRQQLLEQQVLSVSTTAQIRQGVEVGGKNFTPHWLRRLLGTQYLTPWFTHYAGLKVSVDLDPPTVLLISKLHYLEGVTIQGLPTAAQAESWSRVEVPKHVVVVEWNGIFWFPPMDFTNLAELDGLESFELYCPNVLVDDLLPLLEVPGLRGVRLVHAPITKGELAEFIAAYQPRFKLTCEEAVQPWDAIEAKMKRWRSEDGADDAARRLSMGTIDLSGLEVTPDRLKRLGIASDEMEHLKFGEVGAVEGLWEFVLDCDNLESLDLGDFPVAASQLADLQQLKRLETIRLQQGEATIESVRRLATLPKLEDVEIHAVTWTVEELRSIEAAFDAARRDDGNGPWLEAYRHAADDYPIETAQPDPDGVFEF